MTKQYLRKREYLGKMTYHYFLKYGGKFVFILMEWISGEYRITKAKLTKFNSDEFGPFDDFPYRRTVAVIDRIEELLNPSET